MQFCGWGAAHRAILADGDVVDRGTVRRRVLDAPRRLLGRRWEDRRLVCRNVRLRDDEGHAAARLAADRVGAVIGFGGDVVALAHGTLGAVDDDLSGGHGIEGRCGEEWRVREEDMGSDDAGKNRICWTVAQREEIYQAQRAGGVVRLCSSSQRTCLNSTFSIPSRVL